MNSLPDDGKGSKSKRPDRQLYVPRARRSSATDNKETVQKGNDDEDLLKRKLSFTEAVLEDAPEKTLLDDSLDRESNHKETANSDSFTKEKVELINSPENIKEDDLDQSTWDKIFDENGDSLDDSQVINELTLAVGQVEIQKPTHDYLEFRPHDPDLSKKDFSHVLEVYDFPSEYKTADLLVSLSAFKERSFDIKWVDDTHALAVFSSSDAADEALKIKYHFIKVRPLSDAIPESKWKAKRALDDLQPYKPRPPTCAQVARRLVSGALGLRVVIPKEQKELEKLKLKEAKENRRKALRQRHDVWEGTS